MDATRGSRKYLWETTLCAHLYVQHRAFALTCAAGEPPVVRLSSVTRGACEDSGVDAHGLVTIMHVDVEGSTALTTRAGDEAARKVVTETK